MDTTAAIRQANWDALQPRLQGDRQRVYDAWLMWGPCTTRQLAEQTNMDILSLRPRTTELFQLGLLVLECGGREGVYRALGRAEFEERAARAGLPEQMALL